MYQPPHAFTLIEVLITVTLFVILVLGVEQLSVVYGRIVTLQSASIGNALGGSALLDAARAAASQATQVVATHAFSGISYSSGTTTAIFELPAFDASGALIPGARDYIGIHASGTSAYRIVEAVEGSTRVSGTKRLTDALGALSFTYDSADFPSVTNVIVDATTTATVHGETTEVHLRQRTYLHNL